MWGTRLAQNTALIRQIRSLTASHQTRPLRLIASIHTTAKTRQFNPNSPVMPAFSIEESLNIDRIAIIGAGPSGLAGAKYLAAEKKFSKIEIFDQRAEPGGVWNYTSLSVVDNDFTIPRTQPTTSPDTAIFDSSSAHNPLKAPAQFISPVYDHLETNIPHTLMSYTDAPFPANSSLFPPHQAVKQYLHSYAEDLKHMLSLQTQVQSIKPLIDPSGHHSTGWEVRVLDLRTDQQRTSHFDAIIVANGHYNDPFIPAIKGLAAYHAQHPGSITHSKFYRRPEQYKGKKVIIVGNSASGIDLSAQISTVCQLPILVSEKTKQQPTPNGTNNTTTTSQDNPTTRLVPEIAEFIPSTRSVLYTDGTTSTAIDHIIFCTGYFYSFPFLHLPPSFQPITTTTGTHCTNLYNHIVYPALPTLAFLGIPSRIVPFPVAEAQSAYIARIWSNRLPLPSSRTMDSWLQDLYTSASSNSSEMVGMGMGMGAIHTLAFPQDVEYINNLHALSLSAQCRSDLELENDGRGKLPPYWDAEKAWVRGRIPLVKVASRKLGDKRHQVKSLEELGFDYGAWQREQDEQRQQAGATQTEAKRGIATIEVKEVGEVET